MADGCCVFVRVRPSSSPAATRCVVLEADARRVVVDGTHAFAFDSVFGEASMQEELFAATQRCGELVLAGYNSAWPRFCKCVSKRDGWRSATVGGLRRLVATAAGCALRARTLIASRQ